MKFWKSSGSGPSLRIAGRWIRSRSVLAAVSAVQAFLLMHLIVTVFTIIVQ